MSWVKKFNEDACKEAKKLAIEEIQDNEELVSLYPMYLGQNASICNTAVGVTFKNTVTGIERRIYYIYSEPVKDKNNRSIRKVKGNGVC